MADGGSPGAEVSAWAPILELLGKSGGGESGRESRPIGTPGKGVPVSEIFSFSERKCATSLSRACRRS
jgi:hypothetical protein